MAKRKSRRARQQSKAPRQGPARHGPKTAGEASLLDRRLAASREKVEQANKSKVLLETGLEKEEVEKVQAEAEQSELLQRLRRDYNVQHLRDQIAVKVVHKDWREKVLGWKEQTPSQLGRLRHAVLRPVIKDQDWQKQFKAFIATLDSEKWAAASTDNLNRLAEPDRFWKALEDEGIKPSEEVAPERLFYWRAALTTLLLGALRAHSRERERERANPGAEL